MRGGDRGRERERERGEIGERERERGGERGFLTFKLYGFGYV